MEAWRRGRGSDHVYVYVTVGLFLFLTREPNIFFLGKGGFFVFFLMYVIQHCFICRPSDFTVSEDARIEPRTVATLALTARRSNHLARSYPPLR